MKCVQFDEFRGVKRVYNGMAYLWKWFTLPSFPFDQFRIPHCNIAQCTFTPKLLCALFGLFFISFFLLLFFFLVCCCIDDADRSAFKMVYPHCMLINTLKNQSIKFHFWMHCIAEYPIQLELVAIGIPRPKQIIIIIISAIHSTRAQYSYIDKVFPIWMVMQLVLSVHQWKKKPTLFAFAFIFLPCRSLPCSENSFIWMSDCNGASSDAILHTIVFFSVSIYFDRFTVEQRICDWRARLKNNKAFFGKH